MTPKNSLCLSVTDPNTYIIVSRLQYRYEEQTVNAAKLTIIAFLAASALAAGVQAGEVARDQKFLWSSYMICFPSAPTV